MLATEAGRIAGAGDLARAKVIARVRPERDDWPCGLGRQDMSLEGFNVLVGGDDGPPSVMSASEARTVLCCQTQSAASGEVSAGGGRSALARALQRIARDGQGLGGLSAAPRPAYARWQSYLAPTAEQVKPSAEPGCPSSEDAQRRSRPGALCGPRLSRDVPFPTPAQAA